jgi:Flp pilus assembly pilin Flp
MRNFLMNFVRDEQGQDMIEYTLLLGFICLAAVATFGTINTDLSSIWTVAGTKTADAAAAAGAGS